MLWLNATHRPRSGIGTNSSGSLLQPETFGPMLPDQNASTPYFNSLANSCMNIGSG